MSKFVYSTLMRVRPAFLAVLLKNALGVRREPFAAKHGRFHIDPVSNFGHRLMRDGVYEEEIVEIMAETLFPGAVFFDIGSNEGYFACIAGKMVGSEGLVVSVEPQSRLIAVVEKNAELNGLDNVRIVRTAISNEDGLANIFLTPNVNTGSSGLAQFSKYRLPAESVPVTTLGKLRERFGSTTIDLMKIDIESFEWEAILGSKDLFKSRCVKNVAVEIHQNELSRRKKNSVDIVDFLLACDYKLDQRGGIHLFRANS